MESYHSVKPDPSQAQSGPAGGVSDPKGTGPGASSEKDGALSRAPEDADSRPQRVDTKAEATQDSSPHISTILGPLPAAVSKEKTRSLNDTVHEILIVGLVISTALLVTGLILDLMTGRTLPTATLSPIEALQQALRLQPSGFLSLGLLVLMFTPVVRVIGSVIVFIWERDWRYALITLTVLIVMLTSVLVGGE